MPKSNKVRFDGLDVGAMVAELERDLLGRRIINLYDGISDNDAFLIKFDGEGSKKILFLESGIRFHTTEHQSSLQQEGMPSPFCSKLRKHLRGLRLERVLQLGNFDRVVNFVFGTGEQRHSLILELYARGNLLLTKSDYTILALLRSHDYEDVKVKVGTVYPVTYATSVTKTDDDTILLLNMTDGKQALQWAQTQMAQFASQQQNSNKKKKKADASIPLKALLLKPTSGLFHYGPSLLEHCILTAGINPNTKFSALADGLTEDEWVGLLASLKEGQQVMTNLSNAPQGRVLYREKPKLDDDDKKEQNPDAPHADKILEEFQPHLLKQHEGRKSIEYPTFSQAVDDFFSRFTEQRRQLKAQAAESAAEAKLSKIRQDQQGRVDSLQKEQERLMKHAQLVETHAEDVDKALTVINSALDTGMDWEALHQLVQVEQQNENPIALLIKKLELEQDTMVLSLVDTKDDELPKLPVRISLKDGAYGNARSMFAKYRAHKEKTQKTLDNSKKALKAAEANAQRQLQEAQKRSKLTTTIQAARKPHWFEKFHWFITSDNYLVLGGKDAHQNETLVKRYLRPGDAYLHADVHGASSCILRAKRKRASSGRTQAIPLPEQALREAGNFTICRSSAWGSRMVTSAWWVESHQVSKTAPSGEYLTVGSFMIRGKKSFLPPTQLEMGLGVLFRLGDEDSLARHKNERRDFALLSVLENEDDEEEPSAVAAASVTKASPNKKQTEEKKKKKEPEELNDDATPELTKEPEAGEEEKKNESDVAVVDDGEEGKDANKEGKDDETAEEQTKPKKKKGLSVKERKLIKKYGSLEAAEKAIAEREKIENAKKQADDNKSVASSVQTTATADNTSSKRGKKGKMKKLAKRYADQDDEDRELALLALHGGEKRDGKKKGSNSNTTDKPASENQEKAAAETTALLVKDASKVAEALLADDVKEKLAECVTVKASQDGGGDDGVVVRWDKFDGDVLEQLATLNTEQQVAAAGRLFFLKSSTRVDNFSASLSGIIRTIRKYGHEKLMADAVDVEGGKRKTKEEKEREKEAWKESLAAEGIVEGDDGDEEGIDDTVEISKLTGKPLPDDALLYAVPVCAPYSTLSQYKYRVKLTPGSQKRGKASKQCLEMFMKGDKSEERNRELIKRIGDNDWVQVICADVKISAAGASKAGKNKKGGNKGKKKK